MAWILYVASLIVFLVAGFCGFGSGHSAASNDKNPAKGFLFFFTFAFLLAALLAATAVAA